MAKTAYQKRLEQAERERKNPSKSDGKEGRAFELEATPKYSRAKTTVSPAGAVDCYITDGHGKRFPTEVKSGGGCIESILQWKADGLHDAFVIYKMHCQNKNTSQISRDIEPRIFSVDEFIQTLEDAKAIKEKTPSTPRRMIQVSLKKWYELASINGLPYDNAKHYTVIDNKAVEVG